MSGNGHFLARVSGEVKGNVTLRKQQYRISDNTEQSIKLARNFITGKVYNCRWVLERAVRDYSLRIDTDSIKKKSKILYQSLEKIRTCKTSAQLLGLEGEAAAVYFSVFDELILQQKEDFTFQGRNRRPPLDNVNAMLSFAYSLLTGSIMADRFVLTMINKRIIKKSHFIQKESGAVVLTDEGRKLFLSAWQERKKELITHPFLDEKIEWGMIPYVQAMLLARSIRGDLDEYPPFFWK